MIFIEAFTREDRIATVFKVKDIVRTYLRVSDIEQAVRDAESLGAVVALGPTELPGHGTIAITIHGGIEQGIWQLP